MRSSQAPNPSRLMRAAVAFSALALLASGCATSGPKSAFLDDEAAKRSQAYLDEMKLVPANAKLTDSKPCLVPAMAEKPAPGSQVSGPSKDWRALLAHANACVKEKDWKTLEILANAIARIDIDSPWGAYFLSVAAEGRSDLQRAMWMADLAQKKTGGRSGLFAYQKGRLLVQLKEVGSGMKEIETAVQLDASLVEGLVFLAEVHHRDLEFDKANERYQAALTLEAQNYRALSGLAEVKIQAGANQQAADLYSLAVSHHPEQLKAWTRLAYVYETLLKNNAQALSTYKALKVSLEAGRLRERPSFDLGAKIKSLEEAVQPRAPAQAGKQAQAVIAPLTQPQAVK